MTQGHTLSGSLSNLFMSAVMFYIKERCLKHRTSSASGNRLITRCQPNESASLTHNLPVLNASPPSPPRSKIKLISGNNSKPLINPIQMILWTFYLGMDKYGALALYASPPFVSWYQAMAAHRCPKIQTQPNIITGKIDFWKEHRQNCFCREYRRSVWKESTLICQVWSKGNQFVVVVKSMWWSCWRCRADRCNGAHSDCHQGWQCSLRWAHPNPPPATLTWFQHTSVRYANTRHTDCNNAATVTLICGYQGNNKWFIPAISAMCASLGLARRDVGGRPLHHCAVCKRVSLPTLGWALIELAGDSRGTLLFLNTACFH